MQLREMHNVKDKFNLDFKHNTLNESLSDNYFISNYILLNLLYFIADKNITDFVLKTQPNQRMIKIFTNFFIMLVNLYYNYIKDNQKSNPKDKMGHVVTKNKTLQFAALNK